MPGGAVGQLAHEQSEAEGKQPAHERHANNNGSHQADRRVGLAVEGDLFLDRGFRQLLRAPLPDFKFKHLVGAVRVGLSGMTVTPGLFETLELLGKEESIKRLKASLGWA